MAIRLKYTFRSKEESTVAAFQRQIVESLQALASDGVLVTPEQPVAALESGNWNAGVVIRLPENDGAPEEESAEARRIADGMGAPWEKLEDGSRLLTPRTGGFSSNFLLLSRAEMSLDSRESKGFFGQLFG
jgi:hypothetical protein